MKISTFLGSAVLATLTLTANPANAGPLWGFEQAGINFTNGSWVFATSFSVNSDLMATGLGYYADPVTGGVSDNAVALYKCSNADCTGTGELLASVVVTNTFPLTGFFRYVTIDPIQLLAGESYQVAGVSLENNYTWNTTGFFTDPNISLIQLGPQVGRWESGTELKFLNYGRDDIPGQDGFWGPNVFVGVPTFAVPAPGTLGLLGIGLVGLALRRKRQACA